MKKIESATVFFAGDRNVGIPSMQFDIQLYIDPTDYDNGPDTTTGFTATIRDTRQAISDLYERIQGETPSSVLFDFEIQARNDAENKAWADSELEATKRNEEYMEREYMEQCEENAKQIPGFRCSCGECH